MIIYVIIASFLFWGGKTKYSNLTFKTGILLLFIITAFRNPTLGGFDVLIYRDFFTHIPPLTLLDSFISPFALGYTVFNALVKQFSDNYLIFQFVYALVSLSLLYLVIIKLEFKNSEKCFFLFSYFCFHFIWNNWITYRQNLANLLFWLFLILFFKCSNKFSIRKLIFLLFAILLPPLFHTSAWVNVILVPAIIFFEKIGRNKILFLIPLLSIILFVSSDFLYTHFLSFITLIVDNRYSMYSLDEFRGQNLINLTLRLLFFIFFVWRFPKETYPQKNMVLNTTATAILLGSVNAELMTRIYEYYAIGLYCCMALVLHHFTKKSKLLISALFWLGMIAILCRSVLVFDNGELAQFSFWF